MAIRERTWRRLLIASLAVALTAIASIGLIASILSRSYSAYLFFTHPIAATFLFAGRFAPARVVALACATIALVSSTGATRARLAWATIAIAPWYITSIWISLLPLGLPLTLAQATYANNVTVFFAPLGLTYAALSRRIFDIGFVINRAVVFGVMSLIVVCAFVLLEWALSEWVKGASHVTSISANVVLALGLGISMRYIHLAVDRIVDHVFFRKRHEEELELRRFAREAGYITDPATLIERAMKSSNAAQVHRSYP